MGAYGCEPFSFILICFLATFTLTCQELPPVQNYTPIDYNAQNQNWGIGQSEEKNIYVANNTGLLEYNGAVWRLYQSPNGSTIRSVKAIGNTIYTGCYMEFGFWEKQAEGDLAYQSISSSLELPLLEDEEIWNILELDNWVLFQSLERIYIYNASDKSVEVVESKSTKAHMFNFEGTLFFHSVDKGLFKIESGKPVLVNDDALIRGTVVTGIFSMDDRPLLVTEKGNFYFFDSGILEKWTSPFEDNIPSLNIYSSLQLEDGTVVLGTISNGIFQIDKEGNILLNINQKKGLNNNTVLSLFEDVDHNLWLALDNGVSVVNLNSPFNEYIDKNGKLGVVYASMLYQDYLYLGTNQGLFSKHIENDEDFNIIQGTEGQVWVLKVEGDALFCGHNNGTYLIENQEAKLVSNFPGTWDIKPIPGKENLMLQGNFNGLSVLEETGEGWKLRNTIEGFDISSRFFEFIAEGQVAVNREFKGVYKLNFDEGYRKVIKVANEASKGTGASLVKFSDNLLYTCDQGVFKYHNLEDQFKLDTLLTNMFYVDNNDVPVGIFVSDIENSQLWYFTNSNIVQVRPGRFSTTAEVNKIAIPSDLRKNLGVLGFESLTPLKNEKYLIGISNGYLTLNLNKVASKEYVVRINSIARKSTTSALENVVLVEGSADFNSSQNNLSFSYSISEYDKYTEVRYQYQLQGKYDSWSDWTKDPSVSFENLPFGNYTFKVRAKAGNEVSSNVASYTFRIKRPWYLSNLAIALYICGATLLAIFVHKLYKGYYQKQQEQLLKESKKRLKRKRLKAQKKIVQLKNERLQEEVKNKNRELAISTMSIIKKNEFLNAIKDQLKQNVKNPGISSVIRTIDRNINNSDDWKFFEDAFNNADKDFLKKVKGVHPELTSNDLRLCAYLRLNLSSKEIAPLLNISVRSVEVKRYRLRKKMNLSHESGLTDYIMEI